MMSSRDVLGTGTLGAPLADFKVAAPAQMKTPPTRYAKSGDASIAYQVVGEGPIDVVLVLGFATHLEVQWDFPPLARLFERISAFSRLIIFDKRGTGLSDPVTEAPALEQRVDDVRAVMDAAGSERAALFGISEGGPMSVLFAAAHPDRATALILHGAMGRTTEAPDYPWASPEEALRESPTELIAPYWGQQAEGFVEIFAPSLADDQQTVDFFGRLERSAASPAMVRQIFEMFLDVDVRAILPTIQIPTLVVHRHADRVVNRRAGEGLAAQIRGSRYVELPGIDHLPWAGDSEAVLWPTTGRSAPEREQGVVSTSDVRGGRRPRTLVPGPPSLRRASRARTPRPLPSRRPLHGLTAALQRGPPERSARALQGGRHAVVASHYHHFGEE